MERSLARTGDLNRGSAASCGNKTLHHRSDDIGYSMAHDRVRTDKGSVRLRPCVNCGTEAERWSYDHTDPDEMYDLNISAHPDHRDAHVLAYRP